VYERLKVIAPETAERIHFNDLKRIIRAIEIHHQTGDAGAMCRNKNKIEFSDYDIFFTGLYFRRDLLYKRIEKRVDIMMEKGLVSEVESLLKAGYHSGLISMKGLGYKEIIGFLNNSYSLDEAVYLIKRNTRRFAKRQLTWFKRYSSIKWIDMEDYDTINHAASSIVDLYKAKNHLIK